MIDTLFETIDAFLTVEHQARSIHVIVEQRPRGVRYLVDNQATHCDHGETQFRQGLVERTRRVSFGRITLQERGHLNSRRRLSPCGPSHTGR